MKTALRGGFVAVGLLIGVISGSQSLAAQSFSFPVGGFTSTNVCANGSTPASSCQVLTNGSPNQPTLTTSGGLRLTTANTNQHGSAWFNLQQPLSTGFTTAFQFQISSTNSCYGCAFPADGIALVIQNDPAGTGRSVTPEMAKTCLTATTMFPRRAALGNAITNSLAIELDTFQNTNYSDPNGNHIAVQSCGPNNASVLTPNSADHDYMCPNGSLAALALQSLPSGTSLSDGNVHTITVNYLPPGTCTSSCNNLSVYVDSTLILQTTLNIATQLNLTGNGSAYLGFTAATGSLVENNDIVSWSFSSLPLAPITINQPLQTTTTTFNYTPALSAISDYSQSGLGSGAFSGVFMQGTVQTITDQQFSDLVTNTPFQGSTCQHQDTGSGNYACVVTTDLCTTSASGTPSGANCPNTGTNALINVSNTYNLDPSQKPIIAPGYLMGKDTALSCGASGDNTCKGLVNIFTAISGDAATSGGRTNNFNSTLIPILGAVQPSTAATTAPALNSGWTNGSVTLSFNSVEVVPSNNTNPPASLPAIATINYSATGANLPTPPTGALSGTTGSIVIPAVSQGATVVTFFATDSAGTIENITSNSGGQVSSANPTITIQVDTIPPTVSCTPPAPAWQATDVIVPCTASDNAGGSGLVGPVLFNVTTNVPAGTETNNAAISAVTVQDVAGNTSAPQGPFGPFEVDKKPPVIIGPTISPASPLFGQSVTANYSCTDGGSGVVLCGPSGTATISATGNTGSLSSPASGTTGTHTVTINAQDAVGNQSAPSSVTYTVGQVTPTLTWSTPASITYGTALSATQLTATASVAGAFTYTPVAGTLLTAGTHTLAVTFTPTDTTDYTTATATVLLVVSQAAPTISWATPAPITYGTALSASQLNAASNVAGTFLYNPAAGTVLNAGTQILSTTFTPADSTDYSTSIATVTLLVNKAASIISWATPASIAYGTLLSAAQLDATANVPGTFVYTPPAGTLLPAGSQTLAVAFTPTNAVDYNSATAQVTLQVTQPSIGLSPSSLNFGNVKLGNLVFLLETVSNPGTTPLKLTGVSLKLGSGADPIEFGFLSLCSEYLNPGKSCDIVVSFYADAVGTHDATLLVSDTAAGSPQKIPITANVVKK